MYTHERWEKLLQEVVKKVNELATVKGGEYAGDYDRLANFRRNGAALGLPMEAVWGVYAGKHWDAIQTYIRDSVEKKSRPRAEPLDGRALDLIVYLILFMAILEERRNELVALDRGG